MYQSSHLKQVNKKNKRKKYILILMILLLVGVIFFFILKELQKRENVVLQRTWQSQETGIVLTFTPDHQVVFKGDLSSGTYHIISQNTMEYTIEDQTFLMTYHVEKEKLYWGIDENHLECFDLK